MKEKKPDSPKPNISPHGLKVKAGIRLSRLMENVGKEIADTDLGGHDPITGLPRQVTKMEALIRTIWKLALGYAEEVEKTDSKTGEKKTVKKIHKPDMSCVMLIYDRLEGKVGSKDTAVKPPKLQDKVNNQVRKRLNALVKDED